MSDLSLKLFPPGVIINTGTHLLTKSTSLPRTATHPTTWRMLLLYTCFARPRRGSMPNGRAATATDAGDDGMAGGVGGPSSSDVIDGGGTAFSLPTIPSEDAALACCKELSVRVKRFQSSLSWPAPVTRREATVVVRFSSVRPNPTPCEGCCP